MPDASEVPTFRELSPSMKVDALLSDWKAALPVELSPEEREQRLYGQAWEAYLEGDFGFGLWCWHECDRLTNAMNGSVREVTRVLGAGRYLGFSHRRAIAEKVPLERVYRPRKGDMSTPRPEAVVLPNYQLMCVYLVKAAAGDRKAQAQFEIALGELEERRRADPYLRHFETFRSLLERQTRKNSAATTEATSAMPKG
ncbi:MAG: hypothetical protein L3K17_01400 [Thermoplasmata archaeon]|nr:hypothetical protein [Thermoplasmata archaeon]